MDSVHQPLAVQREALRFLAFTNRWFGGTRIVLRRLEAWTADWPRGRRLTIADVGCGGADIPVAVARWAERRGLVARITAVDLVPEIVRLARERARGTPEVTVIRANALAWLRTRRGRFDVVTASLFLHHLPDAKLVPLVRAMADAARVGVVIGDLARTRAGWLGVGALSHLLGNAVVRHDGPLSVRRAFRPAELDRLARRAGRPWLRARSEPWFRVSLTGATP